MTQAPEEFITALTSLRQVKLPEHIQLREIPAPKDLAPYSAAIAIKSLGDDNTYSEGRFVILYDPQGQKSWRGRFRIVSLLNAKVDPDLVSEDLIEEVTWSWLEDYLVNQQAQYESLAGSVTRIMTTSFGQIDALEKLAELELKASWTPVALAQGNKNFPHDNFVTAFDLSKHLQAIGLLLSVLSGHALEKDLPRLSVGL